MKRIAQESVLHPFYGSRRMTVLLRNEGDGVNRKRVQRLMQLIPKPNLSKAVERQVKYPYLLRHKVVERPNTAWCADITYIPLRGGFAYCVAILDWYSRYILA